jgi:mannose-6-phosphate isomerase-like protein (cupin superfamily)
MHPGTAADGRQSLAEAIIQPGQKTILHRHHQTEELYHVTRGGGVMTMGGDTFVIEAGDTIRIPAETPHCVENQGNSPLHILCCCCPAYSHEDTELLGPV